jgi:hypothetical protein
MRVHQRRSRQPTPREPEQHALSQMNPARDSALAHEPAAPDATAETVSEALRQPGRPLDAETRSEMEAGFGHDFSKVRIHADERAAASADAANARAYTVGRDIAFGIGYHQSPQHILGNQAVSTLLQSDNYGLPTVQAKLLISSPRNRYEREADHVADRVMRMPETDNQQRVESAVTQPDQAVNQARPASEQISPLVQPETNQIAPLVPPETEEHIQSLRGNGQRLPKTLRSFFETRFGSDFSNVRIHTGINSTRSASELGARAFTTGQDIFFNNGEYNVENIHGRRLLAHELTHVIQQNSENIVQNAGPAAAAGLAVSAASFAVSLVPAATGGMTRQEVRTSRSRPEAPSEGRRVSIPILRLWAHIAAGRSDAAWDLELETDGDSIIGADTRIADLNGFEGGVFGSSGQVIWNARPQGGDRDSPVKIHLSVEGVVNPPGWGYAEFSASYIVSGDGTVQRRDCKVFNESGNLLFTFNWRTWGQSGYSIDSMRRSKSRQLNEDRERESR